VNEAAAVVGLVRLLGSLPVLRWPLAGALLAVALDLADLALFSFLGLGWPPDYQRFDKVADVAYMCTFLAVALRWGNPERRIAVALFGLRALGVVVFGATNERLALVAFPNLFETWFILVAVRDRFAPSVALAGRNVVLAILLGRAMKVERPGRFQYAIEALYELARHGIVGSVMKSGQATWFPYIAAVFFFVLVSNLLGLLPLPFGEHHQPAYYAATANLFVTFTLALCTFVFTHYAGIRKNRLAYFKNWAPASAPPVLKQVIWGIHAVSEIFRLISLSVRLFANMLAGHAILGVFFAMALIFQSYLAALILQGGSVLIYMFEIFVAVIQAFIFAILSAVYIGGALDQEH